MKLAKRFLCLALLIGMGATTAFAGGPNHMYDYATRTPYTWVLATWEGGAVPVYTDLGNLKNASPLITNARADELVTAGVNQWNAVPTSTYEAQVRGDFASLGLPDINRNNAGLVLGTFNGGGVHVIYDTDNQILQNVLGIFGALGVANLEWARANSPELLEAWVVISGTSVRAGDPNAVAYGGVFTHELGHTANLGHSTVNGSLIANANPAQPHNCAAPYSGTVPASQIETMFPFIGINSPTDTGAGMASVEKLDDTSALSDLYPAAGWPENHATIQGTIRSLLNIRGNGTGDTTEVTAANVIARNVADPFGDCTSAISGDETKGQVGPDGTFAFHGLTPGAEYVVYVDTLITGAYSVPRTPALPGPEEYYNGDLESGNGEADARCSWTSLTPAAGSSITADITLNRVKGAPSLTWLPAAYIATKITADGSKVVGNFGEQYFLYDVASGVGEAIGGYGPPGGSPSISDDGTRIAGNYRDASNQVFWGLYENGAWTALPKPAHAVTGCLFGSGIIQWGSPFGMSGDGQTVVGGVWTAGCASAGFDAAKWTAATGTVALPKSPDSPTRANRANKVSYDGSVIAGWDDNIFGNRRGAYWVNGVQHLFGSVDISNYYGEGLSVARDGSMIVGLQKGIQANEPKGAWRFHVATQQTDLLSDNTNDRQGGASTISDDGSVITGWTQLQNGRQATLWADGLGWAVFKDFLNVQGTYYEGTEVLNATDITADGHRLVGNSATLFGTQGWIIDMPKVVMCHRAPHTSGEPHTIDIGFPDGIGDHLAHGDTIGLCQHGGE